MSLLGAPPDMHQTCTHRLNNGEVSWIAEEENWLCLYMIVCLRFQNTTLLLVPLLFELVLVAGVIGFNKAAHIRHTNRKTTRPILRQKEGIKGSGSAASCAASLLTSACCSLSVVRNAAARFCLRTTSSQWASCLCNASACWSAQMLLSLLHVPTNHLANSKAAAQSVRENSPLPGLVRAARYPATLSAAAWAARLGSTKYEVCMLRHVLVFTALIYLARYHHCVLGIPSTRPCYCACLSGRGAWTAQGLRLPACGALWLEIHGPGVCILHGEVHACVCVCARACAFLPVDHKGWKLSRCGCVRERKERFEQLSSLSRPRGYAGDFPMSASCSVSQPVARSMWLIYGWHTSKEAGHVSYLLFAKYLELMCTSLLA